MHRNHKLGMVLRGPRLEQGSLNRTGGFGLNIGLHSLVFAVGSRRLTFVLRRANAEVTTEVVRI